MITSARLTYVQRWRNTEVPTMEEWIVKMAEVAGWRSSPVVSRTR